MVSPALPTKPKGEFTLDAKQREAPKFDVIDNL